jgi:hypothetical protein
MQQEDWDALKEQMASPYGSMRLQCDKFELALHQAVDSKSRKWVTAVYVDGVFKGAWTSATKEGEPEHEEARRFLRKVSKAVFTAKEVEQYRKALGKRRANEVAAKRHVYFLPTWSSFNSLKKHLITNNTSIERIH